MAEPSPLAARKRADGLEVWVHVQPRASQDAVGGRHGDALRVRVRTAPSDGRANRAVCAAMADAFGLRSRQVALLAGESRRRKRIWLEGDPRALTERLEALAAV